MFLLIYFITLGSWNWVHNGQFRFNKWWVWLRQLCQGYQYWWQYIDIVMGCLL